MNGVNIYDYLVIGAYFLFMLGIGLYFMKVNKGAKEYFAGGSMIPWWVSGMTLYMANFSAWTFTGAAGFAYATGWFAICYFGTWSVSYLVGSQMTASRWRRTRSISPVEYTYTRFNFTTQQFLSMVIALNFTLSAGVQLAATCKLLAPGDGPRHHDGHDRDGRGDPAVHLHGRALGGLDHRRRAGGDPAEHHVHRDAAEPRAGGGAGQAPRGPPGAVVRPHVQRRPLHRALAGLDLHHHVPGDGRGGGAAVLQREGRKGRPEGGVAGRRALPHGAVGVRHPAARGQRDLARPVRRWSSSSPTSGRIPRTWSSSPCA